MISDIARWVYGLNRVTPWLKPRSLHKKSLGVIYGIILIAKIIGCYRFEIYFIYKFRTWNKLRDIFSTRVTGLTSMLNEDEWTRIQGGPTKRFGKVFFCLSNRELISFAFYLILSLENILYKVIFFGTRPYRFAQKMLNAVVSPDLRMPFLLIFGAGQRGVYLIS